MLPPHGTHRKESSLMGVRSQRPPTRRGPVGLIVAGSACAWAAAGAVALAQSEQPAEPKADASAAMPPHADRDAPKCDTIQSMSEPKWAISVEPLVWYLGPSGTIKLPASSGTGPGSFTDSGDSPRLRDLGLENTRLSPAGQIQINAEKFRFSFFGAEYTNKREGFPASDSFRVGSVAIAPGDELDTKLSFATFQLTGGYRIYDRDFKAESAKPDDAVDVQLRIHAVLGARIYDLTSEVTLRGPAPQSATASETFVEPMAGIHTEVDLVQDFTIALDLNAGGFPGSGKSAFSIDVAVAFMWRPIPNVGVQLGWRQLAFILEDGRDQGEFKYSGRLAGLFAGVVFRF
jgi:hypothetical protein